MEKEDFQAGIGLLQQPVLPLVSMVQFLYLTGPFATVAEVIDEMPEPIETGYALYEHPRALLRSHLEPLTLLERFKDGREISEQVVDAAGELLDPMSAVAALLSQRIMEDELEAINSALCGPCSCTLCCVGPEGSMQQQFFEIPLQDQEAGLFPIPRHDDVVSRSCRSMDEECLQLNGAPFYQGSGPKLLHWQNGWSMILPRDARCPSLEESGRCGVYADRPLVCRRPQIFSYVVEESEDARQYRLRSSLLAITDCPYVQVLQDEIAAYAAACELEMVFKENKQ